MLILLSRVCIASPVLGSLLSPRANPKSIQKDKETAAGLERQT